MKLKRSFEDDYGSTPKNAFKKAKTETQSHYRAVLTMQKEQTYAIIAKHDAELEVRVINAKLELLDHITAKYVPKPDKENLESEYALQKRRWRMRWFQILIGTSLVSHTCMTEPLPPKSLNMFKS